MRLLLIAERGLVVALGDAALHNIAHVVSAHRAA